MLLNSFDPSFDIINRVVFGAGDWPLDFIPETKDIVKARLPFTSVVSPVREVEVHGKYSIDGQIWYDHFPIREVVDCWKNKSTDYVDGIVSFRIELIPNETMSIREIGLFSNDKIVAYKAIKEFVVGKMIEQVAYSFTHKLQCFFVTPETINSLVDRLNK